MRASASGRGGAAVTGGVAVGRGSGSAARTESERPPQPQSPEMLAARRAQLLALRVRVSTREGAEVVLSGTRLIAYARDPENLRRDFGLDPSDFFASVARAADGNVRGAEVDRTRALPENAAHYDGSEGNLAAAPARPFAPQAEVTISAAGAFSISGEVVRRESPSIWVIIAEIFAEIFTWGGHDSRTFNGAVGADKIRDAAATIVMAGGSALVHEYLAPDPAECRARLKAAIIRANPDIDRGHAERMANEIDAQIRAILDHPALAGEPPDPAGRERRLDVLVTGYQTLGRWAFRGRPGDYLLRHTLARGSEGADDRLRFEVRRAGHAAEVSAALALNAPAFAALDPVSQQELGRQLFEARHRPLAPRAYLALIAEPGFLALNPAERRVVLGAIDRQGNGTEAVERMRSVVHTLQGRSPELRRETFAVLRALPAGANFAAAVDMINSAGFAALPDGVAEVAIAEAGAVPARLPVLAQAIAMPNFAVLARSDDGFARTFLQRLARDPAAPLALERAAMLSAAPAFVAADTVLRTRMLDAMFAARGAAQRRVLEGVLNSPGFAALSAAQQAALLDRFSAGDATLQLAFSHVAGMFDAVGADLSRIAPAELRRIMTLLLEATPEELALRAHAATAVLPAMAGLAADEQSLLLDALVAGGFAPERAQTLAHLVAMEGFTGLNSAQREGSLRALAVADSARFAVAAERVLSAALAQRRSSRSAEVQAEFDAIIASDAYRTPHSAGVALSGEVLVAARVRIARELMRAETVDDARALHAVLRTAAFAGLSTENQSLALAFFLRHPAQAGHAEALLTALARIPDTQHAAFFAMLDAAAAAGGDAVARCAALVQVSGFASLSPAASAALLAQLRQDVSAEMFAAMTAALATADFAAASAAEQEARLMGAVLVGRGARRTPPIAAEARVLLSRPAFLALAPDVRLATLRLLLEDGRVALPQAIATADVLFSSPGFAGMLEADRTRLARELARGGDNSAFEPFARLLSSPGFSALPSATQQAMGAALARQPRAELANAYDQLLTSPDVRALSADARRTLVAQAINYPNAESARMLVRLAGARWFQANTHADQQRAAKVVAYAASVIAGSNNGEQQSILRNSLDKFLPPDGRFRLRFEHMDAPAGSITFGWAATGVLALNQDLIPADDQRIEAAPRAADAMSVATDTMAHEVNHLMNTDEVHSTYDYFMGEYRAWYVGFIAERGRPPDGQECYDRANYLLTQTEGAYDSIRRARLARNGSVPSEDAQRIIRFMAEFRPPPPLDPRDPASATLIVANPYVVTGSFPEGGPRPEPLGNFNNAGIPVRTRGGGASTHPYDHRHDR